MAFGVSHNIKRSNIQYNKFHGNKFFFLKVIMKQWKMEVYTYTHFCGSTVPHIPTHWFKHYMIMKAFQKNDQLFEQHDNKTLKNIGHMIQ